MNFIKWLFKEKVIERYQPVRRHIDRTPNCRLCANEFIFSSTKKLVFSVKCLAQGGKASSDVYDNELCRKLYEEQLNG